ncbi:MAG: ATP-dependent DNA helicase RecG [Clostridia bacterium]|nr:ATP-dependent DNA helicase RecG [Clostridia bacterium]
MELNADIQYLKGVGARRAAQLAKLGIRTLRDLLTFYPRTYEDWRRILPIAQAPNDTTVCIRAMVGSPCREHRIRKGMTLYKTEITDGESLLEVTFFNSKYAAEKLEQGKEYLFFGRITGKGYYRSLNSPEYVPVEQAGDGLRPIYPQTEGLNSRAIEKLVRQGFAVCGEVQDPLPEEIRTAYCLMPLRTAWETIHFPPGEDLLSEARRRLIFEELFLLELGLLRLKSKARRSTGVVLTRDETAAFQSLLPFTLTGAQQRAIADCTADMMRPVPMNRLLQGDVGSGKTAVAAALIYNCACNGFQSALMAPTEVLAMQHFKTFSALFADAPVRSALLTGATPAAEKKRIKAALAAGTLDFVVGTHALIQKDVQFASLALAVTDEQHRFGVHQRGLLSAKGDSPHTLVMSATPIPRTLALIIYGDLDLSILDEMPRGRQPVATYLIDSDKRERAYGYVKKHLIEGRQGYIVCPLVEEGEEGDTLAAAQEVYASLAEGFFRGFRVGLLHGKMKSAEKKDVMERFAAGEVQLLVATTVIEVGIDVPNAVIMVIENAERFGLSQLHQLRGRIGRGSEKSTCILISDHSDTERLQIMTETGDGFRIADADLKLRGPGDFFGARQHGLPALKVANMMTDGAVIRETYAAAEALLKKDPALADAQYAPLRQAVNAMFSAQLAMN